MCAFADPVPMASVGPPMSQGGAAPGGGTTDYGGTIVSHFGPWVAQGIPPGPPGSYVVREDRPPSAPSAPSVASDRTAAPPEIDPSAPRVIIKPPRPRYPGGVEFYGGIPKRAATFAWSELCATPDPDCALAPVPQAQMKSWYNTYIYVPEERSHVERRFGDRFVPGPNGEWIDVVKARRMSSFLEEKRERAMIQKMEREMVMSGAAVQETRYTDPYSGEHLVACRGELLPKQQLLERYDARFSARAMQEMVSQDDGFDFDNLRIPWPFGRPYRNKQISQHVYDWFDRHNPYIPTDRSMELMELPSMFVERQQYDRWGASGGVPDQVPQGQGPQRVQYVQM